MFESYIDDEVRWVRSARREGNMDAVKMWLNNRKKEEWADKLEISISGEVTVRPWSSGTVGGLRVCPRASRTLMSSRR
jgi:hypothetical protein